MGGQVAGSVTFFLCLAFAWPGGAVLRADDKDKSPPKVPDIVFVPEDDKEMNAAMDKARKSIEDFVKVVQKPKKGQSHFAIKVAIRDGKNVEHFWVKVAKFEGAKFEGEIDNDPMLVKTVKDGDKITVAKDKVEDWMYVEDRKMVGGYTTRLLRDRLTPAERKALDESLPFKIE